MIVIKDLIKRTLTGIIFIVVILGAIYIHPISFLILFCLITGLTLWELHGLISSDNTFSKKLIHSMGGIYLFIATFLYAHNLSSEVVFLPYILFLIFILVFELYNKKGNPIKNWSTAYFAQFYCAGSYALVNLICANSIPYNDTMHTPLFVLAIFIFIWINDTGAYLIGSLLGKHRLFERISPKKSWEGFLGGMTFTLLSSLIFAHYVPSVSLYNWLGFAFTIVIFGTWGDLVESLLKRTLSVKDSGNILPGHGGMLDRFDSFLLAVPAAYVYIECFIRN